MRILKRLSIQSKLILMLLGVSLGSILITAYLGYSNGKSNLTIRVFNQLTSVRSSKADQIESYFKTVRDYTQVLSEDLMVVSAMEEFKATYNELQTQKIPPTFTQKINNYYEKEFFTRLKKTQENTPVLNSYAPKTSASRYLQYYYIAANPNPVGQKQFLNQANDGSKYSKIHARYHPIFRNIVKKFGHYDMFLIDPKNGNIVYTVFKETDYSTSLITDAYSDSNLAKAFIAAKQAKSKDYVKIIDFEPYSPSYGAPGAFIATPIFNNSELIGILAFQLPVDIINQVMTGNENWKNDGLGESGETYLVGSDYLMRSVSRFLIEDRQNYLDTLTKLGVNENIIQRIKTYNTSILQQEVKTKAVKDALTNQTGTQIIKDYRGIPVLSSYAPLKIQDLDWVILSEMDLAEAYAPIYSFQKNILISATLIMLLVTLTAMWLAHIFVKPIKNLIVTSQKVVNGEIDTKIISESEDEFGALAHSFNELVSTLRQQTQLVENKNQENEQLLLSLFPIGVAKRLQKGEKDIAETVSNVSVILIELLGFNQLSLGMKADELVAILNDLVTLFDEATERNGLEKIKTNGETYMAVCGLSVPSLDHDKRSIELGLEMLAIMRRFNHEKGFNLDLKIAINSGDIITGIIGRNKFIYDIFGPTINYTHQIKSLCAPGSILVSADVYQRLQDLYDFEKIDTNQLNGKEQLLKIWQLKGILHRPVNA